MGRTPSLDPRRGWCRRSCSWESGGLLFGGYPPVRAEGGWPTSLLHVRKRGLKTRDLVIGVVGGCVAEREVGGTNLKDKWAVTEQWLGIANRDAGGPYDFLKNFLALRLLLRCDTGKNLLWATCGGTVLRYVFTIFTP